MTTPLSMLLSGAGPRARRALASAEEVDAVAAALFDGACGAWPQLALREEDFLRWVGERLPDDETAPQVLRALHGADLFLTCACAQGVPGAMVAFDQKFLAPLPRTLARSMSVPMSLAEDALQELRARLFLARGGKPARLYAYSGRGGLDAWLRSGAVRTVLNLKTARDLPALDDAVADRLVASEDQELALLKERCQREFKGAFGDALKSLNADELAFLRSSLVEGKSIDVLAEEHGISRATAARRVAAAREKLMELTREGLARKLKLSKTEVKSIVGLVRSQLDLSLQRRLR